MEELDDLLSSIVNKSYVRQGLQGLASRHKLFKTLLSTREMPLKAWDELNIELILAELASFDSNNFPSNIGAGEREGRVFSPMVARRHYRLSHGIGRSGDIAEVQPKAAGSSLLAKITSFLLLHALTLCGLKHIRAVQILPLATGMTLMMCLSALKSQRKEGKYVIWPRIDQKSCFKSIMSANLIPLIVENVLTGDELSSDMERIESLMREFGGRIVCVLATTSCFAPRRPDQIDKIAVVCQTYGIPHVINNAYGVQSKSICSLVNRAMVLGRVDYIVSSLDKNFMVPVGGAFVASQSAEMIALVSRMYPGRGSITPTVDLFITLLSMGRETLLKLLREREERYVALSTALDALAQQHGERKLETPSNPISMGITLSPLTSSPSFLGAMLFQRCVSGARAVSCNADRNTRSVPATDIEGYTFIGWGAHCNSYPVSYLTAAVGVGMTEEEIAVFIDKLEKTLTRWRAPNGSDGAPCV